MMRYDVRRPPFGLRDDLKKLLEPRISLTMSRAALIRPVAFGALPAVFLRRGDGAYVRLSAADWSCPDWPAAMAMSVPLVSSKPAGLGRRLIHRYAAATLGLL